MMLTMRTRILILVSTPVSLSLRFHQTKHREVATVTFQNQGYQCIPEAEAETSANQEKSGGIVCLGFFLENCSSSTFPVSLPAPQFWICSTCKLSPEESPQAFNAHHSVPVLERAGHSLPNPDLLGSPPPWCLQNASLLLAPESRGKVLSGGPRVPDGDIFPALFRPAKENV